MKTPLLRSLVAPVLLLFAVLALPGALHAQLPKIFVASFGNDANDGSRNAPKRNFQAAHDAVAAKGQIVVLDTAGYGKLNINKSVSITVPPGVNGFITVSGANDGIDIFAGSSDVVSLRGLIIEGGTTAPGSGSSGVFVSSVNTVRMEECTIRDFERGVYMFNVNGGHLVARNCTVRDVNVGFVIFSQTTNVKLDGVLTDCTVDNSADTFGAAFFTDAEALGSVTRLTLSGCVATNSSNGLKAFGNGATLYADNCVVSSNTNGVSAASSGLTFTRGNNVFTNNGTDGNFTSSLTAK